MSEVPVVVQLDALPVGAAIIDADHVVAANDALAQLTRRSSGALTGTALRDLIAPEDADWLVIETTSALAHVAGGWQPVAGLAGDGAPWIGDLRIGGATAAGRLVVVTPSGPTLGVGSDGDGIEYDRHGEWELLGLDRVISHDVRGGLRGVTSFLTLLDREAGDSLAGQAREFFDTASAAALRTDLMADRLVQVLRLTLKPVIFSPVGLGEILGNVLALSAEQFPGPAIQLESNDLPEVWGHRALLVDCLAELVTNARKFGASRLTVELDERRDGWVYLSLTDDGPGVDASLAEDAFNLFRLLQPKGRFPGVGMGLPICRVIARVHGGRCWIEPTDGEGTRVRLRLAAYQP